MPVDYTLYLVTDSNLLPPSRTLADQVRAAIRGGVTIVQLREKKISTREFIALGKQIHEITRAHNVPLLINDRVDVALAIDCEGVHIGWDDCDVATARKLLGKDKIIGLSVSDLAQAREAAKTDCDYIGLGPFFATSTKPDANPPLGIEGAQDVLRALPEIFGRNIPVVSIGGIKESNIGEVHAACAPLGLSGHAIVSAIISAPDATATCNALLAAINTVPKPLAPLPEPAPALVARIFSKVQSTRPLIHHITNSVVKNFSANICLALGGSPIMSECSEEAGDLAKMNGALLINMGTLSSDSRELYNAAFTANFKENVPVVFDPVGAGATDFRRKWTRIVMDNWKVDILKGNEGEIRAVAGEDVVMKGVDYDSQAEGSDKYTLTRMLAQKYNCVVVMTGVKDVISDGFTVWELEDGTEFQGLVTGTGCALGTCLAVAAAGVGKVERGEAKLSEEGRRQLGQAALAGVTLYNAAARLAAEGQVGPASWKTAFVDTLWKLASACKDEGDGRKEIQKVLKRRDGLEVAPRVVLGPETS